MLKDLQVYADRDSLSPCGIGQHTFRIAQLWFCYIRNLNLFPCYFKSIRIHLKIVSGKVLIQKTGLICIIGNKYMCLYICVCVCVFVHYFSLQILALYKC